MRVKRRFSTRWGHPYHLQGACAKCRQTLLRPLCFITSMSPESYMEWPAQSKGEDPSVKEECLSQMMLFGKASLRHVLTQYVEHFHHERDHQGKGNVLLFPAVSQGPG